MFEFGKLIKPIITSEDILEELNWDDLHDPEENAGRTRILVSLSSRGILQELASDRDKHYTIDINTGHSVGISFIYSNGCKFFFEKSSDSFVNAAKQALIHLTLPRFCPSHADTNNSRSLFSPLGQEFILTEEYNNYKIENNKVYGSKSTTPDVFIELIPQYK